MRDLPLDGVRVIDLSWVIAGPTATRFLAMMGAEVIKVGSARRPDPSTRGAPFQAYNQSKLYCALNVSVPDGLELAKRLVSVADIVVENFAAGVIERIGLGYDAFRQVRPDIIMVASSGTGHTGPDKDYVAYGSLLQYYTGWNSISGYPGREPIKGGLWADPWVGMELAMIAVAALNHRAATGEGQYIDFSMAEALTSTLPEALLDFQMNGRVREPIGNLDDSHAPHNVYRCAGDDKWVAIAVTDCTEWRALCGVIGRPDMASDPVLATADGRRKRRDEIDRAITEWTLRRDHYEAMHTLQQEGVPAGPSLDTYDVFHERHLRETGYFTRLTTSDGVARDLPGLGWRIDGEPTSKIAAAPVLGQHNREIYGALLGLTDDEIKSHIENGVIY
ncbi:MAG: CoA transferase [Chloroflexi bacterium]|nr:CoA transferase [Chloroflexota bacterium]